MSAAHKPGLGWPKAIWIVYSVLALIAEFGHTYDAPEWLEWLVKAPLYINFVALIAWLTYVLAKEDL